MCLRILSFLIIFATATSATAQSSPQDIEARLLHKDLYLRGLWQDDTLNFNPVGTLIGTSSPTSFTLSGIDVTKVQLKSDHLIVDGRRIGLAFKDVTPERVVLKTGNWEGHDESIHLEIAAPATGDYTTALDTIFTSNLEDLIPNMPVEWQKFATRNLIPGYQQSMATAKAKPPAGVLRVGGAVTPPKVLFSPEPRFSARARALKRGGTCLVYLQVDTQGNPTALSILRPIGLGLDEESLTAVRAYRFAPAMENGEPVRVEINVEVNFKVF